MSKAPPYSATDVQIVRLPGGVAERDAVAVEEPLEIRINGEPVAVTMRTPGHDEELALGFCLSEGLTPLRAALPPSEPYQHPISSFVARTQSHPEALRE